jgi:hypothetical protein
LPPSKAPPAPVYPTPQRPVVVSTPQAYQPPQTVYATYQPVYQPVCQPVCQPVHHGRIKIKLFARFHHRSSCGGCW